MIFFFAFSMKLARVFSGSVGTIFTPLYKPPATRRVLHRPLFNNLFMSFIDNGGLSDRIKGLIPHLIVKPPRGHCYL